MPDSSGGCSRGGQLSRVFRDVAGQARQVGPALFPRQRKKCGRILVDEGNRLKVLPGEVCKIAPVKHIQLDGHHPQRVAVGPGSGHVTVSGHPSATRDVNDIDRYPQVFLEVKGHQSRDSIRPAPGSPGTDQGNGLVRVVRPAHATGEHYQDQERVHEIMKPET